VSKTVLITGSSGLVGSACVRHFAARMWRVFGADSGARRTYFGADGDVESNAEQLEYDTGMYAYRVDVRECDILARMVRKACPDLVIHCAAQPSHDYAADHVEEDFEVNALGTLNMLEACRRHAPDAVFVHLSTNKVYGDAVNRLPLVELPTRYDYAPDTPHAKYGVGEWMSLDASMHSLFGCSKAAADLYVQEYGRYFGMKTVALRCGCLTGGAHAGAEQHGFLAYLARCCKEGRPYRVYGHKGKQVRDNLHAADVARACELIHASPPRGGTVYNLGGGRANSCSVVEAIFQVEKRCNRPLAVEFVEQPRKGDHLVWWSDTRKFESDFPDWKVSVSLPDIFDELCRG
jgi:CDP-paratose 2-epimerase